MGLTDFSTFITTRSSFFIIKKYSDSEPHVGISGISSFMLFLALKKFSVSLKSAIFAFMTVLFLAVFNFEKQLSFGMLT